MSQPFLNWIYNAVKKNLILFKYNYLPERVLDQNDVIEKLSSEKLKQKWKLCHVICLPMPL